MSNASEREVPGWRRCSRRSKGCRGVVAGSYEECLEHLDPPALKEFLSKLGPKAPLDTRGTRLDPELLERILHAVNGPDGYAHLGNAMFDAAEFAAGASLFEGALFDGHASFRDTRFIGGAQFSRARFVEGAAFAGAQLEEASFEEAVFGGNATFEGAQFAGPSSFTRVEFLGRVTFQATRFDSRAVFGSTKFDGPAWFHNARFKDDALFEQTQFVWDARFDGVQVEGRASFDGAQFTWSAVFDDAQFGQLASFQLAQLRGASFQKGQFVDISFHRARFYRAILYDAPLGGAVNFVNAQFTGNARFDWVQFDSDVLFSRAQVGGDITFTAARFNRDANFDQVQFGRNISFIAARFRRDGSFRAAQFANAERFGPLVVGEDLLLDDAMFRQEVVLEAAARRLSLAGASFQQAATIRVRWAEVVLDGAIFAQPSTLSSPAPAKSMLLEQIKQQAAIFRDAPPLDEDGLMPRDAGPRARLISLRRVDMSTVALSNVGLQMCLFEGASNLDMLHIEGSRPFENTPRGVHWRWAWPPVWWWTSRQALAEEQLWRAGESRTHPALGAQHPKRTGWHVPSPHSLAWLEERSGQAAGDLEPDRLVTLYRALRKAREDDKDEPGAADFYYGEMEMRRRAGATPFGERIILGLYWLISGYGLRGLRALMCLVVVALGFAALFQHSGFQPPHASFEASVIYTAQSIVNIDNKTRALTPVGEVLRVVLRLIGPLLLGLALLSVRNRVKR